MTSVFWFLTVPSETAVMTGRFVSVAASEKLFVMKTVPTRGDTGNLLDGAEKTIGSIFYESGLDNLRQKAGDDDALQHVSAILSWG